MIYVTRSCPYCGEIFENWTRDYRDLGEPYVQCLSCKKYMIRKHITEWELKNWFKKLCYLLMAFDTCIFWAILPVMIYVFIVGEKEAELNMLTLLVLYSCGVLFFGVWMSYRFSKDMAESKVRMQNPDYRRLLVALGLLSERRIRC